MSKKLLSRIVTPISIYDFDGDSIEEVIKTIKSYYIDGYTCKFEVDSDYNGRDRLEIRYFSEETDEENNDFH